MIAFYHQITPRWVNRQHCLQSEKKKKKTCTIIWIRNHLTCISDLIMFKTTTKTTASTNFMDSNTACSVASALDGLFFFFCTSDYDVDWVLAITRKISHSKNKKKKKRKQIYRRIKRLCEFELDYIYRAS